MRSGLVRAVGLALLLQWGLWPSGLLYFGAAAADDAAARSREAMLKTALQSVVRIDAVVKADVEPQSEIPSDLRDFFKAPPREPKPQAGSGFVIDSAKCLILTADYVVQDIDRSTLKVRFDDDAELPAKLVGRDEVLGVALLKADCTGKPALRLSSRRPILSEDVFVAAHAYRVGAIVTHGRTSALDPVTESNTPKGGVYLIDAIIHKGMGGGPVLAQDGSVIGMAYAQFGTRELAPLNLGVAARADGWGEALAQLAANGRIPRGWIGMSGNNDFRTRNPIVTNVEKDGPADRAGLKVDDVIVAVDGKAMRWDDLARHVALAPIGADIALTIRRGPDKGDKHAKDAKGSKDLVITIRTQERPKDDL